MKTDLHTHSTASDGTLSPSALIAHAAGYGVSQLALTDHDTTAGLAEARAAALDHGMRFVDGIEISVSWQKRTLHVVGLGIDPDNQTLAGAIARLAEERTRRAVAIGGRLERIGIDAVAAQARDLAGEGQITRAHFARALVAVGAARHTGEAFKRYLAPGKPGYERAEWIDLAEAIGAIQAAGGVAGLAHPFGYRFTHAWRRRAIAAFAEAGGDALEIVTGVTDRQQEKQAARDAAGAGLYGSAGSDFHSPEQIWLAPGRLRDLPSPVEPLSYLA